MSELATQLNFEILALDPSENSIIKSEVDLLYLFRSYSDLWKNASLDEENLTITDGDATLEVQKIKADVEPNKTFLIKLTGDYNWLEAKRINILSFLAAQNFDCLYILLDEISQEIATQLYPLIYQLENALRTYLTKFMITKVGVSWWKITATSELSKKVNDRKNNEKDFSQFIDNKLYLADFGDLGQLIYKHSSGFITKEDILKKIAEVEETSEAIRKLKNDLQSNYQKFFREHFKNNGFQDKWQEMEKLRHKVAHNNLFTNSDLERGKTLFDELMNIIDTATKEVDNVILEQEEKEAIEESIKKDFIETQSYHFEDNKIINWIERQPNKMDALLIKYEESKHQLTKKIEAAIEKQTKFI